MMLTITATTFLVVAGAGTVIIKKFTQIFGQWLGLWLKIQNIMESYFEEKKKI